MNSFLKEFKLESELDINPNTPNNLNNKPILEIEDLKEILIPCWNDLSHKYYKYSYNKNLNYN